MQNPQVQSPPPPQGPVAVFWQTPPEQELLQQSLLVVQVGTDPPMLTHAHVPALQNWLVQSPPDTHCPPTLFCWQTPPEQLFVVQSLLLMHAVPALTVEQAPALQNLLQHWPPVIHGVPTVEHVVVDVVPLTQL